VVAHTGATSRRDELPPSARMLAALDASWCGYMNVTKRSGGSSVAYLTAVVEQLKKLTYIAH
jgi:hypothetical protein